MAGTEIYGECLPVHPSAENGKRLKIAVVGTGIGGLSCAYLLSQKHDVVIYEREAELGMDAHSVDVDENTRVDAPPRAFSPAYYKQLWNLYVHSGVELEPFSWAYSLGIHGAKRTYMRVGDRIVAGYRLPSFRGNLLQALSPGTWLTALEALRFFRRLAWDRGARALARCTVGDYLDRHRFSPRFAAGALLPMLSMVLTCDYAACRAYPMDAVAEYLLLNSSHTQYRTRFGSRDAVRRLSRRCHAVHLGAPVDEIRHGTSSAAAAGGGAPRVAAGRFSFFSTGHNHV